MNQIKSEPDYLRMDFDEARRLKWQRGIAEHRKGDESAPFQGDRLKELAQELYDAVNYMEDDAREVGDANWSIEISFFRQTAAKVRAIYFRRMNGG